MEEELNLVYIGENFYFESSTTMSSLYTEDGSRSDWGKVNVALRNRNRVHIRPATEDELALANVRLAEVKQKNKLFYNKEDSQCPEQ